jgi:hypothetical protein
MQQQFTPEQIAQMITVRFLAEGKGLHLELDETGLLTLVLWGITQDQDECLFEMQLTPEQINRINEAETVDAWEDDSPFLCQKCPIIQ